MSWTVACFCGNVYFAPPDRCDVCGRGLTARTQVTWPPARPRTPTRCTASTPRAAITAARSSRNHQPVRNTVCPLKTTRPSWAVGSRSSGAPACNPTVIDELAAPVIRFEYSLHQPLRGRDEVREFALRFREAFPDLGFAGTADLIAEGDYVVGQWHGGGTHTGPAFDDLPVGSLPAGSGQTMQFTGTTVIKVIDGMIAEELGLDDGVTVAQQLGLIAQQ